MIFRNRTSIHLDRELTLDTVQPSDADMHYGLLDANRAFIGQYEPWLHTLTREQHHQFVEQYWRLFGMGEGFCADIRYASDAQPTESAVIGSIGIKRLSLRKVEIFFWLAEPYTKQGLMTRVVKSVSKRLVLKGVHRIQLLVTPDNQPAQALAERALYIRSTKQLKSSEVRDFNEPFILYYFP